MPTVEPYDLAPREAAAVLSVHVDTLKAWSDAGLIACWRTAGNHRRYRRSDLDAFLASRVAAVADPTEVAAS